MARFYRNFQAFVAYCGAVGMLAGCATVTVAPGRQETAPLVRPERVLVYDFSVAAGAIQLDGGLGSVLTRYINDTDRRKEATDLGMAYAKLLSSHLAVELSMRGIQAYRGRDGDAGGESTAVIKGRFIRIDEGNGTLRAFLGFGLGRTEVRTHAQFIYGRDANSPLLADAESTAKSNLKPGMTPVIGIAGVGGSIFEGAVVAGTTATPNERFFATAEADAKRTAVELAEWVVEYYRRQGWLVP